MNATRIPVPNRLRGLTAISAALTAFLMLFLVWPVGRLVARSLTWQGWHDVLGDTRIRGVAWFSIWQATLSVAACIALAVPLAGVLARLDFPGRRALLALASAPFTLPTVVVGNAFLALAPTALHRTAGLIISAHIFFNAGYLLRALVSAWEHIDPRLGEAAATLGASPLRRFATITRPLLMPAIRAASTVVFALCFSAFGTVLLLGGPRRSTIDVEIYRQTFSFGRFDRAAVLALLQLLFLAALLIRGSRRARRETVVLGERTPPRRAVTARDHAVAVLCALAVAAFTLAPLTALTLRALRAPSGAWSLTNFRALTSVTRGSGLLEPPLHAVWVSLRGATLVAAIAITVSLGAVTVLTATTPGRSVTPGRYALRVLLVLPLATSAVTLGLGALLGFARSPIAWRSSWFLVPLVQTLVCLPLTFAILLPAFDGTARHLSDAAATLGASPWRAWSTVRIPAARTSILAATGISFAVALGEFGAASLLVRPAHETVPVAIGHLLARPGAALAGQAAALSVLLALLTAVVSALTTNSRTPT